MQKKTDKADMSILQFLERTVKLRERQKHGERERVKSNLDRRGKPLERESGEISGESAGAI